MIANDISYYYIVDGVISDPPSLPAGPRILVVSGSMMKYLLGERTLLFDNGEGPYASIKELKKHSKMFRALLESNSENDRKRAIKIFESKFLLEVKDAALYAPKGNDEFEKLIAKILIHSYYGTINKDGVLGVHCFNPDNLQQVRVTQVLGFDLTTGVASVMIEVRRVNSGEWIPKKQISTLFPSHWTPTYLVAECKYAYLNRVNVSDTMCKGITRDEVLVVFIFDSAGSLKTLYPICEELDE